MRGRLIQPMLADIARLDTSASETAAGPDPDFRSPKISYPGNIGVRASTRRELPIVQLQCQVEMGKWEGQRQLPAGNAPDSNLTLVFFYPHLEAAGLVDTATGEPLIRVNDRLVAIRRVRDGGLTQIVRNPPGLFATEVQPAGIGLGGYRNLLVVVFDERPEGLTT